MIVRIPQDHPVRLYDHVVQCLRESKQPPTRKEVVKYVQDRAPWFPETIIAVVITDVCTPAFGIQT